MSIFNTGGLCGDLYLTKFSCQATMVCRSAKYSNHPTLGQGNSLFLCNPSVHLQEVTTWLALHPNALSGVHFFAPSHRLSTCIVTVPIEMFPSMPPLAGWRVPIPKYRKMFPRSIPETLLDAYPHPTPTQWV